MACMIAPANTRASGPGDAFAFSGDADAASRSVQNVALLMATPWMAYWALAFEAMNPDNYRG